MSRGKFASLTAGLLVRKGEARPSAVVPPAFSLPRALEGVVARPAFTLPRLTERMEPPAVPAQPGPEPRPEPPPRPEPRPRSAAPPGDPPPPVTPDKPRRLMVTLTPSEYETLGLIGVKKGVSRHQLLREALDEYLALLVEEFGGDCQCIYTGVSCGNSCGGA